MGYRPRPPMLSAARQSLGLLPPRDRGLFGLAVLAQSLVALMDVVGVMLLAATVAVALGYAGSGPSPVDDVPLLGWASTQGWSSQSLVALMGITAAAFLMGKSSLALMINRQVLRFLASRQLWISARLSKGLLALPMRVIHGQPTQRWVYAATDGVNVATSSLLGGGAVLISEGITIISLSVFLVASDPVLALATALLFGGTSAVMYTRLSARAQQAGSEAGRFSIDARAYLQESLNCYRELNVYRRLDWPAQEVGRLWGKTSSAMSRGTFLTQVPRYLLEIILVLSVASVTVWSLMRLEWQEALAVVALFLVTASRLIPSLMRLQQALITVRTAAGQAEPTYALADLVEMSAIAPEGAGRQEGGGEPVPAVDILASNLAFTYPSAGTPTLTDVSFEVPAGTSVAIVGPSGSGKSTLADVLLGLHEISSGSVLLGGMSPQALIDRHPGTVSYVPQVPALLNGSIRSNVALGVPSDLVDDEAVWAALEKAQLADLVRALPAGLDTSIEEHGTRLSGGQRQRLGIARALYIPPSILILDEATSALDAATEAEVTQVLAGLSGTVTSVTIAHRLSTVLHADQVIYLDGGRVLATGTFSQVRAALPAFDRQAQLSGMRPGP